MNSKMFIAIDKRCTRNERFSPAMLSINDVPCKSLMDGVCWFLNIVGIMA